MRATAYRPVRPMHAAVPLADIHADADPASERIDQLIFGEAFDVLDQKGDRLWGRARRDGLVGWISASALKPGARLPTHRVAAVAAALPLNALVADTADVSPDDLAPIGAFESDPVAGANLCRNSAAVIEPAWAQAAESLRRSATSVSSAAR